MRIYIKEYKSIKLLKTINVDAVSNVNVGDYVQIHNPISFEEGNYIGKVMEVKHVFNTYSQKDEYEMTIYVTLKP